MWWLKECGAKCGGTESVVVESVAESMVPFQSVVATIVVAKSVLSKSIGCLSESIFGNSSPKFD